MPRPGSGIFHPDFFTTGQQWSKRSMIGEVVITRQGEPVYDPVTNTTSDGTTTVWSGPARMQDVQPFGGSSVQQFGDQPTTTSGYFAVIPLETPEIRIEDIVTWTTAEDPEAVGRAMRVTEVLVDGYPHGRRLRIEEATTPAGD